MPEAIHYDVHSVCMYHSYYTYKKWQVELHLLNTSITLPTRVKGCEANEVKCPVSIGLGGTHTSKIQQSRIHVYATGYTQDVAYKRASVASVQGACAFNSVWV